jgi:undecaprenyl diphosphate synthase
MTAFLLSKINKFWKPNARDPKYTNPLYASPLFDPQRLAMLNGSNIPRHIAIIPDGNRRWAKKKAMNIITGHRKGADNLISTVKAAKELGIKTVTFYLFSTENWNRPETEIHALMALLERFLIEQRQPMLDNNVRFHTIGNLSKLSPHINQLIEDTKNATAQCDKINMVAALNYGARDEITRAFQRLLADCLEKKISQEEICEQLIAQYLDTAPWPDPDLLIRTSGERRMSNFLLWQLSYGEIYAADRLWPDFVANDLLDAVLYYQSRNRRFGGE